MPNTFKPTFMPQAIAEGPLAVIQEDEVVLALEDVTVDALSTDLPADLDEEEDLVAAHLLKRQEYAYSLRQFHKLGSDSAKVNQKEMSIVRRDSVQSISSDDLDTPPIAIV